MGEPEYSKSWGWFQSWFHCLDASVLSLSYENICRQRNWLEFGCDSLAHFLEDISKNSGLFSSSNLLLRMSCPFWLPTLLDFPTSWNPGCSICPWMCQQMLDDTGACRLLGPIGELPSLSFTRSEAAWRPVWPFAFTYTGTNNSFWESCHSYLCDTSVLQTEEGGIWVSGC